MKGGSEVLRFLNRVMIERVVIQNDEQSQTGSAG
jgi:hypothetical protein